MQVDRPSSSSVRRTALDVNKEATFSDLRAAYPSISENLLRSELQLEWSQGQEPITRLLLEFLHDPDVRARWNSEEDSLERGENQTQENKYNHSAGI
jgi:hypothetical protein